MQNAKKTSVLTHFNLGKVLEKHGDFEKAFTHYQETLSLQSDYFPAYQKLGDLMLRQRRTHEALEYYEQALSVNFEETSLLTYYQYLGLPENPSNLLILTNLTCCVLSCMFYNPFRMDFS